MRVLPTLLAVLLVAPLGAQVAPYLHWETIGTEHFRVHFAPGLEYTARRAAGSAERAYGRLASELVAPRGPIDLAVADNEDISNGFTTTFPTNRIIIFARPTVDATALKFLDDWVDLVVSHELAHVFHLDRSRGWWRVGQWVFGRNPFLFPNQYSPNWLSEGIAVYYESRLTGAGRIEGTDDATILRTLAMDSRTPRLNALSAASLRYPLGESVYAYGAMLVEHIARSLGREKMRDFIEISAARTIPFLLNRNARAAFGMSFDSAYEVLSDSVKRDATAAQTRTAPGLRVLTTRGWFAQRLRWSDNTHLLYGSNDGRSVSGIKEVSTAGGAPRSLGRRNSLDVTSPLPNGARVCSQLDFTDPYTLRADLYYEQNGNTTRLTNGERIMQPDARLTLPPGADAAPAQSSASAAADDITVVAVQILPGASRLVRVTVEDPGDLKWHSGRRTPATAQRIHIVPLTSANPDTIWSEPRFSHDGTRIVATRWLRNAVTEIVILDSAGKILKIVGRSHSVNGSPSWVKGDTAVLFTSDRSGRPELYRASLTSPALERIATVGSALVESEQSPDGAQLATLLFRGDGYHVATMPMPGQGLAKVDSTSVLSPSHGNTLVTSTAPARPYSAWPSVVPRYWLPALERTSDKLTSFGFITSGSDILSRHAYDATVTYEPQRKEPSLNLAYEYTGLGNPVFAVGGIQEWDHAGNITRISGRDTVVVGTLRRRRRFLNVQFTQLRPRVRTNASVSLGGEVEFADYRSDPAPLFDGLRAASRSRFAARAYPSIFASGAWSNAQRPTLAISPENGIHVSLTARRRWRADSASSTGSNSVIGTAAAYNALDLPGFAHHVLAVRAAAGWADAKATNEFDAGGVSGGQFTVAPGVALGNGRRTFPVRGFDASSQQGIRALAGSVEYRAPLFLPSSGLGSLPLFVQRVSAVAFADAATSWCPGGIAGSTVCPSAGTAREWMASAGAELQLEAAYSYDVPYRFRIGAAVPVAGRKYFGTRNVAVYFAVGLAF
ncbi:MAG TPA: hypothetical protein VHE78_10150 [Gemmatimonadaceae bacterium]|nr:hypothetical protein [Gemmatimonadaceae bacterium]